jgi:LTXXQ motif family protein
MRKLAVSALALMTFAGGLSTARLVYAQAAAPTAVQTPAQTQTRPDRPRHQPGERIEARLAYLKTALKITPAQEPQWNALADVLRQQAKARDADMQQRRSERETRGQNPAPASAIDRLQRQQQRMTEAAARLNDVVTAARPLYASFTDDQKKVADEMLDHGGRHMRGRWH